MLTVGGRRRRTVLARARPIVVLAVLLVPVVMGPTAARAETFTVSTSSVAPGSTVTFAGDGCLFNPAPPYLDPGPLVSVEGMPGAEITIESDPSSGTFTGTIAIPATAEPGHYQVSGRCQRSLESGLGFTFWYLPPTLSVGVAPTTSTTTTTSTVLADPTTPTSSTTTTTACTLEHPCPGPGGVGLPGGGRPVEDLIVTSRTTVAAPAARAPPVAPAVATSTATARNLGRTGMATDRNVTVATLLLSLGMLLVVAGGARLRHRRGLV